MNDLERDLRETFEQRARRMDAPVGPPPLVLRRGRRRQIRTATVGAVATVLTILLVLGVSNLVRTPVDAVPGEPNSLPARVTSIGGVSVTAPAGWTLIDDTPLLNVVATTSEKCSFSGGGTPVDQNGAPVATPSSTSASSCASAQTGAFPAGVPFLQLANFEIPLMDSVCSWNGELATPLPRDGVALYVASYPTGIASSAALDACPGADRYMGAQGENAYTFGLGTADGSTELTMAAIAVAGPDASEGDLSTVQSFFGQPIFGHVGPYVAIDPHSVAPGYVLAAGGTSTDGWRLEAGIKGYADGGRPLAASIFTTVTARQETAATDASLGNSENVNIVGDQVVQHGNLASGFTGVEVTGRDGSVTNADVYMWPQGLLDVVQSQSLEASGGTWVATLPEEGDVAFIPIGTTQPTPAPDATPTGQHLQTRETANGLIAYGTDFGHDWEIHLDNGVTRLFVDGVEDPGGSFSFAMNTSIAVDVDGGTFLIGIYPLSMTAWTVTVDGSEPPRVIAGRSTPAQANDGHPANLWVVALPGTGTGVERETGSLPTFVSWPTPLYPDGLFGAGSDGVVSWGIVHHTDQCALVKVIGADPADSGTSDCLPSWYEFDRNGDASPLIGGVYGQQDATVTIVLPGETQMTASGRTPRCVTVRVESNFANTEFCVFSLPVGETTTVTFGANGDAFGGPIDITARAGVLNLAQGSASATPST